MQYQKPFNAPGANDPYVNGNPGAGIQGSIPPAQAIEYPMRELVNFIEKAGITPSDADLFQVARAVRGQRLNFVDTTGTANALAFTIDPAPAGWTDLIGVPFWCVVEAQNSAAVTVAFNGASGAKKLTFPDGTDLGSGVLKVGEMLGFMYDGTNCQIIGGGALRGAAGGGGGGAEFPAGGPGYLRRNTPDGTPVWAEFTVDGLPAGGPGVLTRTTNNGTPAWAPLSYPAHNHDGVYSPVGHTHNTGFGGGRYIWSHGVTSLFNTPLSVGTMPGGAIVYAAPNAVGLYPMGENQHVSGGASFSVSAQILSGSTIQVNRGGFAGGQVESALWLILAPLPSAI